MYVVILSLGMPFNGDTLKTRGLGGSESAAYYLARELARQGHHVSVFTTEQQEGVFDGVRYCYAGQCTQQTPMGDRFEYYAQNTPHDVLVLQRHPQGFHKKYAAKVTLHQMHDLALHRYAGAVQLGGRHTTAVTCVSEFHKKQTVEVYGLDPRRVHVVHNGVDLALYDRDRAPEYRRSARHEKHADARAFLYQSRPERGLEHLVRPGGIMDRLRDTPNHLFYCAYENTTGPMVGYYAQLDAWAAALPNVTKLGALTKQELADLQRGCDALLYPSEFEETSCITAMECMAAGLPIIASHVGALPETCEAAPGGARLIPLKDGKADEDAFVDLVLNMSDDDLMAMGRCMQQADHYTWREAADELLAVVGSYLKPRNEFSLIKHAIEHSDIKFAQWYFDELYSGIDPSPALVHASQELRDMYAFAESPEAYAAHYDKHLGIYYDGPGTAAIGEDVTGTSRFRGVASLVEQAIVRIAPTIPDDMAYEYSEEAGEKVETSLGKRRLRVLDYGCAHGHYLIPLAKAFPDVDFVGADISDRAIGAAMQWVQREGLTNVTLHAGVKEGNVRATFGVESFDVIMANEVIEHVPDYLGLMASLKHMLRNDGQFVASTPYGRWEWMGHESFKTGREHLHHFERGDIADILLGLQHEVLAAPAGVDEGGEVIGSWVWSYRNDETVGLKPIDYARKWREYGARETVSACMIVKDGERSLLACLESLVPIADEVIIALDPATTDKTLDVVREFGDANPWLHVRAQAGLSAMTDGFGPARNESIRTAAGDWVLWADADEVLHQAQNAQKLRRPSMHNAYAMQQVHYSIDPATVLTTDWPSRLFRNDIGILFWGLVHEHPETVPGKAIPHTMLFPEAKFLHNGYVDEVTRRRRFQRNLPLLLKDVEVNPDRKLNKFLLLRDLAQGIQFEIEQYGGKLHDHDAKAMRGIKLFEEVMEMDQLRLAIDALAYYTTLVNILGGGFEAQFTLNTSTDASPDLACATTVKGRFLTVAHYQTMLNHVIKESTKRYESRYL